MNNDNKIHFVNREELNPIAFSVMGASVKNQDNPIGFFGSGVKYSIAIMLRLGVKFSITTHGKTFDFKTIKENFRGSEMEIVTCNGENLGYTTEFGKQWELEHVFRELYCNARDEGGSVEAGGEIDASDKTVITVDDHRMYDEYLAKDSNFLFNSKPIFEAQNGEIHELKSGSVKRMYLKGVKTQESHMEMLYAYNVKDKVELSEDRTVKYTWKWNEVVSECICQLKDKKIIKKILSADNFSFECNLAFEEYTLKDYASDEFLDVAKTMFKKNTLNNGYVKNYIKKITSKSLEERVKPLNQKEEVMLEAAYKLLETNNYYPRGFELFKFESEHTGHLGQAYEGAIWISEMAFKSGPRELALTILEEFMHLKTGYSDMTREFQNYIFEQLGEKMEQVASLKEAQQYALS